LSRAAQDLPVGNDYRLIGQEKIHLTLKFLGGLSERELDLATRALERLGGRHEPFGVSTSGFGAFPSERRARVLWVGVKAGADQLRTVANDVENLLETAGFDREDRPYVPHLTLGRAKGRQARLEGPGTSPPELRFTVSSVELVQSVTGRHGATYQVLTTFPF
jgi:RNA 2',3'-cyclic 3'-phosphodiesterase